MNIFLNLSNKYQETEVQTTVFEILGEILNPSLTVNRSESFEACDERLKVFLEAATSKKYYKLREDVNVQCSFPMSMILC